MIDKFRKLRAISISLFGGFVIGYVVGQVTLAQSVIAKLDEQKTYSFCVEETP